MRRLSHAAKVASAAALLLLALSPAALAEAPAEQGVRFDAELRALSAVVACDGRGFDEARFDAKTVAAHCEALGEIFGRYDEQWLAKARPFFAELVPQGLPKTVVYPFGGADLLTALAIYPDLTELTSLSLEAGGDPRPFTTLDRRKLNKSLRLHRQFLDKLVTVNHSRTLDLARLKGDPLPSQIVFALVGLATHGYEPVSLRYFRVAPEGGLHYLTAADIAEGDAAVARLAGSKRNRKLAELFGSFELTFRRKGAAAAPIQTYRHISANLDDAHIAADPRVLKHLQAKGKIAAMTKAASYLLWWRNFETVRRFLLDNVQWMVSDSTGIPPNYLDDSWEIVTYGRFRATAIRGSKEGEAAYREAWSTQPRRELPFMFGYPSKAQHPHLVVTRRK
ncbi:MAG: hypothetical protein CSA66_06715 [Proteobacteria bacterium]|nr:MAG: hypothetical protein CSA66_06715 [Pseudomonadota bacterium]